MVGFMKFGETLRNLMDERDLSQKQLAIELKITQSTLGGYVQDTREPDFETLKMFAKYFNVSTDYLLNFQLGKVNTQNENEILRIVRSLSKEQQELYIEQGKAFIRHNQKEKGTAKSS